MRLPACALVTIIFLVQNSAVGEAISGAASNVSAVTSPAKQEPALAAGLVNNADVCAKKNISPDALKIRRLAASDPSQVFNVAAEAAHNATIGFASAAMSFLPQQDIGGCSGLTAAFASARAAANTALQIASASGTNGSSEAAAASLLTAAVTPLCGGMSTIGVGCVEPTCKTEILASKGMLASATAMATKACLLAALATSSQGQNALRAARLAAPMGDSSTSLPAADIAAAAAQYFDRAVRWQIAAGACSEAQASAQSAASATNCASQILSVTDPSNKLLFRSIVDATQTAMNFSTSAASAAAMCNKTTVCTDSILSARDFRGPR